MKPAKSTIHWNFSRTEPGVCGKPIAKFLCPQQYELKSDTIFPLIKGYWLKQSKMKFQSAWSFIVFCAAWSLSEKKVSVTVHKEFSLCTSSLHKICVQCF